MSQVATAAQSAQPLCWRCAEQAASCPLCSHARPFQTPGTALSSPGNAQAAERPAGCRETSSPAPLEAEYSCPDPGPTRKDGGLEWRAARLCCHTRAVRPGSQPCGQESPSCPGAGGCAPGKHLGGQRADAQRTGRGQLLTVPISLTGKACHRPTLAQQVH